MILCVAILSSKLIKFNFSILCNIIPSQLRMHYENLSNELNEFILSFNTTACFGIALFICLLMREYNNTIKEETIDSIADNTIKFMPGVVINLIDKLHGNKEVNEELSPV